MQKIQFVTVYTVTGTENW